MTARMGFLFLKKPSVCSTSRNHPMVKMTPDTSVCLLDEDYEGSFAFRAALVSGAEGFHITHEPGTRGDFLQALQQLGAEPRIRRLQKHCNDRQMMQVHVSCSRDHWVEVFGEPEGVEEITVSSSKYVLYRWKHSCSDCSVTCIGHLFEKSPGIHWVVVMRVEFYESSAFVRTKKE